MQQNKPQTKVKEVPCPNCKNSSEFSTNNPYRPFCSERCKMIDLGDWANENYKLPDNSPPTSSDDMH